MTGKKGLERFVRARIGEGADGGRPSPQVRSHRALLDTVDSLRRQARKEGDWAWAEAAAGLFGGWFSAEDGGPPGDSLEDAFSGDDPVKAADAVSTRVLACVAVAYDDHPSFDPGWLRLLPERVR